MIFQKRLKREFDPLNSQQLKYEDIVIEDAITIPNSRAIVVANTIHGNLFATIAYWGSASGIFGVVSYDVNIWVYGDPGVTIDRLKVRCWYI